MIRLRNISKSYQRPGEGELKVLNEVDFEVARGEFVAIVGPSGSGKSTLMNILGLLDTADSGTYELAGSDVSSLSTTELARTRNRTIGFVFQQFHLLPRTTATENVELPLVYSSNRSGSNESRKKAVDALCRVGLEERLTHYPSELSGGQQQRVAIARALINVPDVILADEPTGNLDQAAGARIMELFQELNDAGSTILLITHDAELARQAPRVVQINDGRLSSTVTTPLFQGPGASAQQRLSA
ncbi:MAG: ATP-binding cassette domain-containing protein [Xanthomonadales bacterium]|nr:ATP-binding cassette domain-containing protein [Xanthomonadales bacterium]